MPKPYKILLATHPVLKRKATPVEKVDTEIKSLLKDMLKFMYESNGAGLAAPQIGIEKRLVTMDVRHVEPESKAFCMVNPEIIWSSKETKTETEYCLSVPGIGVSVKRPAEVKVRYLDENGKTQELHATGFMAYCIQHEIDHLDGITTLSYLSALRRKMALKKLQRIEKHRQEEEQAEEGNPE